MTEPNLDKQIDEILEDLTFHPSDIDMDNERRLDTKQAIKALIANQVAEARIDELEHIVSGSEYSADDFDWYEITRAEYTGTKYYSEVRHLTKEERIAELEATLNGVKK